ncbi:hypothetical protein EON64_15335 [archaeon]|nr:MAG: hypothetical protein EON64_15335 [archaeon]
MTMVRLKQAKIASKLENDEKRLVRLENKSYKNWEKLIKVYEYYASASELDCIEAKEEYYDALGKLQNYQENVKKISFFCSLKGEEELKCKSKLTALRHQLSSCQEEITRATQWYEVCVQRSKNRDKLKRKVVEAVSFVDTDSINGYFQRFETARLRDRIYQTYFKDVVYAIVNRAELIVTERKCTLIQGELAIIRATLKRRITGMKRCVREIHAEEYLRMKRSYLNTKIFSNYREKIIRTTFQNWIRYYYWNKGHEEAFKLKFEVIKYQMDLKRKYKTQLVDHDSNAVRCGDGSGDGVSGGGDNLTLMQRVRERVVCCVTCKTFYLGGQNHPLACTYHPQRYTLSCPATCPNPGLTAQCPVHRKKRWLCCKQTSESAGGCCRRYHSPPDTDAKYDSILQEMYKVDMTVQDEINERYVELKQKDFVGQIDVTRRERLREVEEDIDKDRQTAERYKQLKFV